MAQAVEHQIMRQRSEKAHPFGSRVGGNNGDLAVFPGLMVWKVALDLFPGEGSVYLQSKRAKIH